MDGSNRDTMLSPPWSAPLGDEDEGSMWLAWLIRLRWVAIVGQAVTLSFAIGVLDSPFYTVPALSMMIAGLGAFNLLSIQRLQANTRVSQEVLLFQLIVDVLVLTSFFVAAGGPENPFIVLYMIHISMGAVILRPSAAMAILAVVVGSYEFLHLFHLPLHPERHALEADTLMSVGQSIGFSVTALSLGLFVLGMSRSLRQQRQTLIDARERTARIDRLRTVGTLAAGAAHELNTPLSTVIMRTRRVGRRHDDDATRRDLGVVATQLQRCVDIVQRLLFGAGDPSAGDIVRAPLADLVENTLTLWCRGTEASVVRGRTEEVWVELPRVSFSQALTNLLENAREAQEEQGVTAPLEVHVLRVQRDGVPFGVVEIYDQGRGLPSSDSDRVGEPFFTTKPTGTGLGVFVARQVADAVGGGLTYQRVGTRTLTSWWFPETGAGHVEEKHQREDAGRR